MKYARFILSKSNVLEQYKAVKALADDVSYSFKTNPKVGKVLEKETDSCFSLHSIENLDLIKDKKRIWLFGQAWDKAEMESIFSKGIRKFVVDNENDLEILLDFIGDKSVKIDLLLRMKLKENTIHTGKYFVFGMSSDRINKLIPKLKQNKNITQLGIHIHRKSQNISEWSLKYELEQVLSDDTLAAIDLLNLGGGLPWKYKNFRADVIEHISSKIIEVKEWLNKNNIKVIIEPGRFIAAPSVKLETEIINIYDNNIIINCSIYNTSMDTFVANIRLLVEGELKEEKFRSGNAKAYTIKGCTPCSMDLFRYRVFLKNPKIGDKIVFLNAGAYNFATDFCGLQKLDTVTL